MATRTRSVESILKSLRRHYAEQQTRTAKARERLGAEVAAECQFAVAIKALEGQKLPFDAEGDSVAPHASLIELDPLVPVDDESAPVPMPPPNIGPPPAEYVIRPVNSTVTLIDEVAAVNVWEPSPVVTHSILEGEVYQVAKMQRASKGPEQAAATRYLLELARQYPDLDIIGMVGNVLEGNPYREIPRWTLTPINSIQETPKEETQ